MSIQRIALTIPLAALLLGCAEEPLADFEVDVEIDDHVATVLNVSWSTEAPGVSWVEFGRDGAYDLATPISSEASTEHSFSLLGVGGKTEVSFRCVTETDEGQQVHEGTATTGEVPAEIMRFRSDVHDEALASADQWMLTGFESDDGSWMVAIDRRGSVVWYEAVPNDGNPYTVELLADGPGLLYNARKSEGDRELSWLVNTSLLDSVNGKADVTSLPLGHHGMTQLPRGGIAWIANDVRPWLDPRDGQVVDVVGDAIMVRTPEGDDQTIFSSWDWCQPTVSPWFDENFYQGAKDWTHANDLSLDEESNRILFSLRNLALLLEVDMASGEVTRFMGGENPEAFTPGSTQFAYQHDPHWTEDGTILLVSTTRNPATGQDETLAIEYEAHPETGQLNEVWSYGRDLGLHASYHGGADALPNGNRLVNFGSAGIIHEVTAEGELAWSVSSVRQVGLGSTLLVESLYDLTE